MLLLIGAPFLWSADACKKSNDETTSTLVAVQAARPEFGSISERIGADATLSPLAQAAISPKITAPVHKFYVQRGSHVTAGELLAELENRDLTAAALDNQGQYESAQAVFAAQTRAQVPEDFQKAELDVRQTKAQLDLNQSIVTARQQLFNEGAIPGRDLDTAQAALVQAKAAYDAAEKHFESMQKVSREAALQQAQGQLTSTKGKYMGAEAAVSYSMIRSPIAGIVTDRPLFPGETATVGTALLTVMDTSSLLAKVHLAQVVAQSLSVGDEAQIDVPGSAQPVRAKISLVSPALDPGSTTVEVWLQANNREGRYKVGTPVRTWITGRTVLKALKVPLSAVLSAQDGSKSVMVVGSDGVAHRKPVTIGVSDGDDVQILQGITAQDMVITTGAYGLDDGTRVKVGAEAKDDSAAGESK
jgi:HlyD family secretion protein